MLKGVGWREIGFQYRGGHFPKYPQSKFREFRVGGQSVLILGSYAVRIGNIGRGICCKKVIRSPAEHRT